MRNAIIIVLVIWAILLACYYLLPSTDRTVSHKELARTGWVRTWGAHYGSDTGNSIAIDEDNNLYVVGTFEKVADFDPGMGVDSHQADRGDNIFLSKFDSKGNFHWARTWGGGFGYNEGNGVSVDSNGNIYVTGYFSGITDFDPGPRTYSRRSTWDPPEDEFTFRKTYRDVFLSKFDRDGKFIWVRTWGGRNWDNGEEVITDNSGNVYVRGWFFSTLDFDPGPGVETRTKDSGQVFLSKFNPNGIFQWVHTWPDTVLLNSMTTDKHNNILITGKFSQNIDCIPGSWKEIIEAEGSWDGLLMKMDPEGRCIWVRTWTTEHFFYDEVFEIRHAGGAGVRVDDSGYIYVVGTYSWSNPERYYDPTNLGWTPNVRRILYLKKYNLDGNLIFSSSLNGSKSTTWGSDSEAGSFILDPKGGIYICGGVYSGTGLSPRDAFIAKFNKSGSFKWAHIWEGERDSYMGCNGITTDTLGNIYATGDFYGALDFDPGREIEEHTGHQMDAYMMKVFPNGTWWGWE